MTAAAALLPCAPARAQTADPFQRGFTITAWSADAFAAPLADQALTRMAGDGSTNAAVFTQWFMDSPTSSRLAPDASRTPSDASMIHAIGVARAAGMAVTIKPQIGIRTGNWIGFAHPADLDAFWADYRTMLLHYADLAEQNGATMLVVGTEMATLSWDEAHWRPLIAEVRHHFHGQITYAANYDEYERVPFWDALDYVGIDAYFGLADDADPAPSVQALTSAWTRRGYLARIAAVSQRTGKRVLFTEIGYRGIHSTAVHPNQWNTDDTVDLQAQANAYEAFYAAVSAQPWLAGVYWWGVESKEWWVKDYNPMAKPAEQVMIDWNKRLAAPPLVEPPKPDPPPASNDPAQPTRGSVPADDPARTANQIPLATPILPRPAVLLTLHARRLTGRVTPHLDCRGHIKLSLRVKRGGRWHRVRSPAPFAPRADGHFHRFMRKGRLRVRAIFVSNCRIARSRWIATH